MYGTLIASTTVGAGGTSSIDFNSISGTYTDLYVVLSHRATSTTSALAIKLNGVTTTFAYRMLTGNGSTVAGSSGTNGIGIANISTDTASVFGNLIIHIPGYAGSQTKTFSVENVAENNATAATVQYQAGQWTSTAAITSVGITLANFAQYTTAYLYGLTKGSGGATVA